MQNYSFCKETKKESRMRANFCFLKKLLHIISAHQLASKCEKQSIYEVLGI